MSGFKAVASTRDRHAPVIPFAIFAILFFFLAPAAQSALLLSATTGVTPLRAPDLLHVEFTVSNTDAFTRNGVVVEMVYPAALDQLFESAFDGDCPATTCSTGETVTWTLGAIPAGGAVTMEVPAFVTNNTSDGTVITFAPMVTDSLADSDSASVDVTVDTDINYDLTLAENSDPTLAGALLTYKLSWGYLADAAAVTNSTLRFNVPANTTFVSATGGGVSGGGSVDWALGFLNPGVGGEREVTVQLDGGLDAGDVIGASAEIFAVSTPSESATSQASTVIAATNGLQVALESSVNAARPFEVTNHLISVTNNDPSTRFGVVLTGIHPQDHQQTFESQFDGDCPGTTCSTGERVTWTLGDIAAGGSVTVDMAPIVSNIATGGELTNFSLTATDTTGLQARQTDTIRVKSATIYDLSLSEDSDPATAGSTLTYKLTFGHRTDAAAVNNSMLSLPVPVGTTFVSATGGGTLSGGTVEWGLGFLQPGDGGVREATFEIGAGVSAATVIEAAATVFAIANPDESARAEANTVIAATRGLQLAIQSNANPARLSESVNWQLSVTNTDPVMRFGVVIEAVYPQDMLQAFESEFDGDCVSTTCTQGERVTWTIGEIAANETITVPIVPTISNVGVSGNLINLYAQATDDQGAQTRQLDTTRVQTDAIYDLTLSENADPAAPGDELTYRLMFGYRADASAVNQSVLRLPLPAGTTFVSATDGGTLIGGVVEWQLGFLSPGGGGEREATVLLNAGLAASAVIEAAAEVGSVSSPIEHARAEANTAIENGAPLQLAIEINPEPVRPSELTNYQLTVTNSDPVTRFGVVLTGYYPQDLNQVFESTMTGQCGSTTCTVGERITWTLGDIPGGDAKTVNMPPVVASNATDGVLINLYAAAQDDQGAQTHQMNTMRVQSDAVYDLSLYEDSDPATAGSTLVYTLAWGYRDDAAAVSDSRLRLNLPDGVTLVSTTGGGVQSGDDVDWNLGFLDPGDSGIRTATVTIDGGLAPATVLEATASVFAFSSPDESAGAEANTAIRATLPLSLTVEAPVYAAEVNRRLPMELTVTNNDAVTRFGVALQARFPQNVLQLFESDPEFIGDCGSTTCTFSETVSWPLMNMAAGESVTLILPPQAAAPVVDGRLINFFAWVEDDQGVQARGGRSVITGCIEELDVECDGILDSIDNCLGIVNTDQRDSDGDGLGNRCDTDIAIPNNCITNAVDLGIFKVAFFATPALPNWNPDADFNGDNIVNTIDLGILKSFFFQMPGPSAQPNACMP